MSPTTILTRFEKVKKALDEDGFNVVDLNLNARLKALDYVTPQGFANFQNCLGVMAEHKTAFTGRDTENKKKAYYIEGSPYQMGFLMGLIAEKAIAKMSVNYVDNVMPEIFDIDIPPEGHPIIDYIKSELLDLFGKATRDTLKQDVPEALQEEIRGIKKGCKAVNQNTKVKTRDLWTLNFGVDLLFAYLFTGAIFKKKRIPASMLKVPIMCNAFSLHGSEIVGGNKHFFGRDFMFFTANVFQDVACLTVYNPASTPNEKVLPFVSQTAPGFVGSIAAMNSKGVAMGVDVFFSGMCNPNKPGFNSLGLVRDAVQHGPDLQHAVDRVINAQRGVAWLYPIVDGKSHDACFIEAGFKTAGDDLPYFTGIPKRYRKRLPDKAYLESKRLQYGTPTPQKGLMVRRNNYKYPEDFIQDFNKQLWKRYSKDTGRRFANNGLDILKGFWIMIKTLSGKSIKRFISKDLPKVIRKIPYKTEYFDKTGYITKQLNKNHNCPGPYYFAPQREDTDNIIIVTNHAITPEMRLTSMADWIAGVTANRIDDNQWRYDELNNQLLTAVEDAASRGKPLTEKELLKIIDFLRPNEDNPKNYCRRYYNPNLEKDPKDIAIVGSVSLFELESKTVWSRFGYYSDEWVRITLPKYI